MDNPTTSPAISVIMSVYNGERYLRQAISSILAQSFRDFEFIIVNDGSRDKTAEILNEFEVMDSRIKIFHQDNQGLVFSLNRGIQVAKGSFVARMDADDISHPERLSLQMRRFAGEPSILLLGSAYTYIDGAGRKIKSQSVALDNDSLQRSMIKQGNPFCHSSVMIRASALQSVGGYRSLVGKYAQDYDLWLRLSEFGEVENLNAELIEYRVHCGQVSIKNVREQRRAAEIYRELALQRRSNHPEDIQRAKQQLAKHWQILKKRTSNDYLHWSALFEAMEEYKKFQALNLVALKEWPFNSRTFNAIWRGLLISFKLNQNREIF